MPNIIDKIPLKKQIITVTKEYHINILNGKKFFGSVSRVEDKGITIEK